MRPQEHGNKRDVRWVKFIDEQGTELKAEALMDTISVSAWPYTLKELWDACRISELPEYSKTTINLDCIQNELGDAFVPVPEKYVIKTGEILEYAFRLSVE